MKEKKAFSLTAKTIAIWSPGGNNTANISYNLSCEFSKYINVLLVELPCMGIPRLGFAAGIMDRANHTETALLELDKEGELSLDYIYKKSETLSVLASNVFAVPDSPVTHRVQLETLLDFPSKLVNAAHRNGSSLVIFDCQGQITSPLTFFALKQADTVLLPLQDTSEVAYCLLNVKRLSEVFEFCPDKFKVIAKENRDVLSEVMSITDYEGKKTHQLAVLDENMNKIVGFITGEEYLDSMGNIREFPVSSSIKKFWKKSIIKLVKDRERTILTEKRAIEHGIRIRL